MAYQLNKNYVLYSYGGTGQCLTVYGGTANNNQNVCVFRKVGTSAQNWTIKAFGSNLKIVTGVNQNYALNYYWSAGQGRPGNCDIYPQSGNDADSSIELNPVSTDVYRIKLKNYDLYLTAKGTGDNGNSPDVRWEAPIGMDKNYLELAPQEWRLVDPAEKGIRAPFIFAGYFKEGVMYSYTDAQLSGLGNATEFVINGGAYSGYFKDDGTPNEIAINNYAASAAQMAKRLYTMYGKQVWIGTPEVWYTVWKTEAAAKKAGNEIVKFLNTVMDEFVNNGLDFNTVVKGIYMHDENIYEPIDADKLPTSNYQVSVFQAISNYAASKGKKMMWSPSWSTTNLNRAARVIHQTNIFDYAVIQPGYFFNSENGNELNCGAIRKSIAMQRLCYAAGAPILHESVISCYKTVIGCQMEIDWRYNAVGYEEFKPRYETYETVFNGSYGAYDKYNANFGFYFGCPAVAGIFNPEQIATVNEGYDRVKAVVNNFFK